MFWIKTQGKDIHFSLILLEYTLFTALPSGKMVGVSRFCLPLCKGEEDISGVFWNSTVIVGCFVVFLPGSNVLQSLGSVPFIQ